LGSNGSTSAHFTGFKTAPKTDRPVRLVAGPGLSPSALRLASLPPHPELAARLNRANAAFIELLRKKKALIKPHHPPVNVLGGYRFPNAPKIDLSPIKTEVRR